MAAYVALCFGARWRAVGLLTRTAAAQEIAAPEYSYVFPEPWGPRWFRGVLRYGDTYRLFLLDAATGRVEERGRVRTLAGTAPVERVRRTAQARRLEWFFAAPVWTAAPAPGNPAAEAVYEVYDLRFHSLLLGWRRRPFTYRFAVVDGRVGPPMPVGRWPPAVD
ncbi:MAG: hypothetical protein Kow0092_40580 [Deferrisomatales bacterium]